MTSGIQATTVCYKFVLFWKFWFVRISFTLVQLVVLLLFNRLKLSWLKKSRLRMETLISSICPLWYYNLSSLEQTNEMYKWKRRVKKKRNKRTNIKTNETQRQKKKHTRKELSTKSIRKSKLSKHEYTELVAAGSAFVVHNLTWYRLQSEICYMQMSICFVFISRRSNDDGTVQSIRFSCKPLVCVQLYKRDFKENNVNQAS